MTDGGLPADRGGGAPSPEPGRSRSGSPEPGFPEPDRGHLQDRSGRDRRHRLRWTLTVLLVLVLLAGGGGVFVLRQLKGNIHHDQLFAGTTGNAGVEKPDPFGRLPINLLLIGSDTRASTSDCHLGGDCSTGPGQNADVEMVVHVSADRSNVTVMSVPRDTETDLPACADAADGTSVAARHGQINSTLTYGPGCTVAAVHQLTGIPIDHFVMVDFEGVINMSDSVGGVSICVDNNVYDPYSHLKLAKGRHTLKGLAALEFVRSRHGFGDGSDLGRTYAQHAFLSAVIRSLKKRSVLLNPAAVLKLAEAATRALTVDTSLDSVSKLLGLAEDVNKVPADRVTFTTMQTAADPTDADRVVVAPAARALFATIINDRSLTAASGAPSVTASPTPVVSPAPAASTHLSRIVAHVSNGSGEPGRATVIAGVLRAKGFSPRTSVSVDSAAVVATTVQYGPGRLAQARAEALAKALKIPDTALKSRHTAGLTLVIGSDWATGTTYPSRATAARAALDQAHPQNATSNSCVQVSRQVTVAVNGIPMTPIRAFSESPAVRVSAR